MSSSCQKRRLEHDAALTMQWVKETIRLGLLIRGNDVMLNLSHGNEIDKVNLNMISALFVR